MCVDVMAVLLYSVCDGLYYVTSIIHLCLLFFFHNYAASPLLQQKIARLCFRKIVDKRRSKGAKNRVCPPHPIFVFYFSLLPIKLSGHDHYYLLERVTKGYVP